MGSANENERETDYHNPNAENFVLQPGQKRVRFSFCEAVSEAQINPAYEDDEDEQENTEEAERISHFQKIRARRRDSVYPIMDEKAVIIETESEEGSSIVQTKEPSPEDDPFAITDYDEEPSTPWSDLTNKEKLFRVGTVLWKILALLTLLYFFVCSLDLLSKGFRLVGGKQAGELFQNSDLLQNPVVGVMIGILTTVLVQSSSTSTSIIVGMVAAKFIEVQVAVYIIMGCNIGTSITNTIVSFMQSGDKEQFRRAFAAATILDMFNWLTVIVLLIVEVLTGYLYYVSKFFVDLMIPDPESGGEIKLLNAITEPFVDLFVQLDESVMDCWSNATCAKDDTRSLVKRNCETVEAKLEVTERIFDTRGNLLSTTQDFIVQSSDKACSSQFIFANSGMSDVLIGVIVLVGSLIVLCTCLILIVKLLSSVLRGHVSVIIKKIVNADIPYVPWITGYIAILVGAVLTFLVQSSSVFTSALTPLVGLGVITVERVYPLTLGANIGTTTTAVLASFAVEPSSFNPSMQIALCHFFFNITGILIFYPIKFMRLPINLAKFLGNVTCNYRWFAIFYMVMMFAVLPAIFILLSLAGSAYVIALVSIIGISLTIVIIITFMQKKFSRFLPPVMRNWKFLPKPMRSLQPYDDMFMKLACCKKCRPSQNDNDEKGNSSGRADEDDQHNFVFYSGSADQINSSNIESKNSNNKVNSSNSRNYDNNGNANHNSSNGRLHNRRGTKHEISRTEEELVDDGTDNDGYHESSETVIV